MSTPTWQEELNGPDRSIAMNRTTWLLADALGLIEPDADRMTLDIAEVVGKALDTLRARKEWRCFHCEESFTDSDKAAEHFGKSMYQKPICQIDAARYREMEEYVRRAADEDTDALRQVGRLESDHRTALIREEEKGYARGMADIRKESTPIVESLLVLALASFHALDDSEERQMAREIGEDEVPVFILDLDNYETVCTALDTLDLLPDDKPGYTMDGPGRARWALRNLLGD